MTKDYQVRAKATPFGIGQGFDDLKTNAAISTVQRENVWHPYYEVNLEEMDFKEKMMQAAEEKKMANVGGAASAPIVASAFHPSLATVGVLLAVFGYAIGTIAAIGCTILLELAAPV